MNSQKYIIANWKKNGNEKELESWIDNLFQKGQEFDKIIDNKIVLCPPSELIHKAKILAQEYNKKYQNIYLTIGSQNYCDVNNNIAHCEIDAKRIRDFGASFVIVGHSDYRLYGNETNDTVREKVENALVYNIKPVICVGENELTKNEKQELDFVLQQAEECIPENTDLNEIILAYEPIWSIGNGRTASYGDIEKMASHLKYNIAKKRGIDHNIITVLYGGSVIPLNSKNIMQIEGIDGLLVGEASLNIDSFFEIVINTL